MKDLIISRKGIFIILLLVFVVSGKGTIFFFQTFDQELVTVGKKLRVWQRGFNSRQNRDEIIFKIEDQEAIKTFLDELNSNTFRRGGDFHGELVRDGEASYFIHMYYITEKEEKVFIYEKVDVLLKEKGEIILYDTKKKRSYHGKISPEVTSQFISGMEKFQIEL